MKPEGRGTLTGCLMLLALAAAGVSLASGLVWAVARALRAGMGW